MLQYFLSYRASIHVKLEKFKKREISLFASWERGRICAKPFRDINFVYQYSNSGWNFENDEILPPYNGLNSSYGA